MGTDETPELTPVQQAAIDWYAELRLGEELHQQNPEAERDPEDFKDAIRHRVTHQPEALAEVEAMYKSHLDREHAIAPREQDISRVA